MLFSQYRVYYLLMMLNGNLYFVFLFRLFCIVDAVYFDLLSANFGRVRIPQIGIFF